MKKFILTIVKEPGNIHYLPHWSVVLAKKERNN